MNVKRLACPLLHVYSLFVVFFVLHGQAYAYIGPGAGFAVITSFLTLCIAILLAVVNLITWPVRRLFRMRKYRRAYVKSSVDKVIICGLDGLDPGLVSQFMDQGKLPNLARLRSKGSFSPLQTTCPSISPVAFTRTRGATPS